MHVLARDMRSSVVCLCMSLLIANARGSYTFYTVGECNSCHSLISSELMSPIVPGDTQSSIAVSHNVTSAALQLANPQLSDQDYGLPGEVVQIPAACSNQTDVHIAVPGDTIVDIAKDYNVDLGLLEKANPQITDLDPGDCIEIPTNYQQNGGGEISPSTAPWSTYSSSPTTSTSCDSESTTSAVSSSYSAPSGTSCTFAITASGGLSCPAGQLSDGQIRLNGSYPSSKFSISNGQITDASGRGCIITRESPKFQRILTISGADRMLQFPQRPNSNATLGNLPLQASPLITTVYSPTTSQKPFTLVQPQIRNTMCTLIQISVRRNVFR
jgi:LysM repeat protein